MARIIPFFIFYFCSILFLHAQQAIRYTTDNGLPTNHIYQIEQDPDGFMWFATNMGVVKFDGKEFKTYTTQDGLPTNDIWRIEATSNGRIWYFAKSKKLGYIHRDSVFAFPLEGNSVQHPYNIIVYENTIGFTSSYAEKWGNYEFKNGGWVMGDYVTLKYRIKHLMEKGILLPKNKKIYTVNGRNDFLDEKDRVIYTFKAQPGIEQMALSYSKIISRYYYYKTKENFIITNPFYTIIYNLADSTVYAKNLFQKEYTLEEIKANYPEVQQYGENYQISRLNEWVAFDQEMNILDRKIFSDDETPIHIYKDKSGNFWKGDHESGITVYPHTSLSNIYSFTKKKIQTINFENGKLFVNVMNEGWYVIDPISGKAELIIPNIGKVYEMGYHEKLKVYYFYNSTSFWYGKNLHDLARKDHIFLPLYDRGLRSNTAGAKAIIELDSSFLAVNLISYFSLDSNFTPIAPNEGESSNSWYTQGSKTLIKHNNRIYVGGDGLHEVKGHNIKPEPHKNSLLQASINTIIEFNKEFMLVGTDGFGAFFYDGDDIIIPLKESEGYIINKIVIDKGNIWMATGKGIHQYTGTNVYNYRKTESIYDEDGLLENNVNSICIVGNKLYVAHDNGMVCINLNTGKYKKHIKPYYAGGGRYYDITKNTYTIEYGTNISLPFKTLGLPSQKYISYYYKTNTDDHWIPTEVPTLGLGKQPPGKYVISFLTIDQHKNISKTSINLVVVPLWYQTLLFKLLCLLVILVIVILATLFFRKRVENKKKAELLLSKTLSDLELKALRSQMNPHFVFNSLNAIQYYIIKNKPELSEEYLAKFSRLIRLFFEYSKYDSLKLYQELDLLSRYLEIEKLRFENKLEYDIYVDPKLDAEDIEVPSMILQPIVENAVNHGIFHKKGNGLINLIFKKMDESTMLIRIMDDGVGILAMKEIQQDDSGNYRSKSSEVLKERLKILSENKLSKWKVDYKIEDRSISNPDETGTLVEIILHYKH